MTRSLKSTTSSKGRLTSLYFASTRVPKLLLLKGSFSDASFIEVCVETPLVVAMKNTPECVVLPKISSPREPCGTAGLRLPMPSGRHLHRQEKDPAFRP